jgi:DNA mismatch repair protein MutL
VDNGKGMSFTDARICFERHATSKISCADDLFKLTTKGFRGEALASIAAIAHVELKTKQAEQPTGTQVIIEGSQIKEHTPIATQDGTSISIKNLFYNVPARRNFLKSDAIELSHIEEEFCRVALIHTHVGFSFYHNGNLIMQLAPSNFKLRIVNVFGNHLKEKLYPIEQETGTIKISGFIAKPENARKRKNDQYLFVNNRFISHFYIRHAIESAYKEIIPEGYKPAFFIQLELDPATIDVNISPTKVDIKFQDEKLIYGILHATVRKSLGSLSLTPQIDFDYEPGMDVSQIKDQSTIKPPTLTLNPDYNPFSSKSTSSGGYTPPQQNKPQQDFDSWNQFLSNIKNDSEEVQPTSKQDTFTFEEKKEDPMSFLENESLPCFNFTERYLVCHFETQVAIIDIVAARERILYEQYLEALQSKPIAIQQNLFPDTITLSASQVEIINEIKEELHQLGYDLEQMDRSSFAINGTPSEEDHGNLQQIITEMIENYKTNQFLHKSEKHKNIALSLAKQKRNKYKVFQSELERITFLRQLYDTLVPSTSPSGKKIVHYINAEHLTQIFG